MQESSERIGESHGALVGFTHSQLITDDMGNDPDYAWNKGRWRPPTVALG